MRKPPGTVKVRRRRRRMRRSTAGHSLVPRLRYLRAQCELATCAIALARLDIRGWRAEIARLERRRALEQW